MEIRLDHTTNRWAGDELQNMVTSTSHVIQPAVD